MKKCLQGGFCRVNIFGRYWVYVFKNKWQWATLDHIRRPEWFCSWFVSVKTAELLASRLKQWNLDQEDVRITSFRNRNKDLASFFDIENQLCYCTNIPGLFTSLSLPYNLSDWRLFIESSKWSLKGVLLHNGNKYPGIPIAHSVYLKESYDNIELLLEAIKYSCSTMWLGCQSRRFNCLFWRETRQRILGPEISPYPEVVRGRERGSWRGTRGRAGRLDSRELVWIHGQGQSTLDSGDSRRQDRVQRRRLSLKMSAFEVLVEFLLVTHASDSPHMHIVLQYLFSALG